jgi:dolichol-phosphate mannosyltransferase
LRDFRAELLESHTFDVLVVDDNSPDGTGMLVSNLNLPWVFLEVRSEKSGLGDAYKHGFRWAIKRNYSFVIEMDADGSHRVADLNRLLFAPNELDLTIGSRWIKGGSVENWPFYRQLLSRAGNLYAKKFLGFQINDSTAGYRRISIRVLELIPLDTVTSRGYGFQIEMAYRISLASRQIREVPITFVERTQGESKMNSRIVFEALLLIAKLGFQRLLRVKT